MRARKFKKKSSSYGFGGFVFIIQPLLLNVIGGWPPDEESGATTYENEESGEGGYYSAACYRGKK
jgi:hypothetical protein